MSISGKRSYLLNIAAGFAIAFGVLTIASGGVALFSSDEIRHQFGNVVQFVLWFNFVSGFAYVLIGLGLWMRKVWAVRLSVLLFLAILGVFAYFLLHVFNGGAFEMRTVVAMTFRAACWLTICLIAIRQLAVKS